MYLCIFGLWSGGESLGQCRVESWNQAGGEITATELDHISQKEPNTLSFVLPIVLIKQDMDNWV